MKYILSFSDDYQDHKFQDNWKHDVETHVVFSVGSIKIQSVVTDTDGSTRLSLSAIPARIDRKGGNIWLLDAQQVEWNPEPKPNWPGDTASIEWLPGEPDTIYAEEIGEMQMEVC